MSSAKGKLYHSSRYNCSIIHSVLLLLLTMLLIDIWQSNPGSEMKANLLTAHQLSRQKLYNHTIIYK